MAYRSSLNVSSINKSLSGLNKSLLAARESAKNVNATIVQSTKEKRKSFSANIKAFNQRREAVRRKEREDIVEASTVKGAISRSRTSVASSTRGFLGRIMDFLGTLLVGWAITNLPNIIKMAQSLMKRMQTYFGFLNQFKDGLQDFLISFGSMVGGVASSLGNFDFIAMKKLIDKGMGKMKDSFVQMSNSLNNVIVTLKQDINKLLGLDLFDIPGSDGDDDGGGADPSATPPEPSGTGVGSNRATQGTPEQRALLDAIAFAEGTTKSYGVVSGGAINKDLEEGKLTVREVIALGNSYGTPGSQHKWSGATGRYQFMPFTLNGLVARGKLKYDQLFTPALQDIAALMLIERRGVTNAMLKREGISVRVSDLLAPEFAPFPYSPAGGKSYYGQPVKRLEDIQKVYNQSLGNPVNTTTQPAKAQKVSNFTMNNASKTGAYAGGDPEKSPRIGDIISSNNSQKSTLLASNLQQTRQKPGTNTLLYNNEVIKTVYMPSNSYGGDVIVLAGGVNSGRRNRFLNSLA